MTCEQEGLAAGKDCDHRNVQITAILRLSVIDTLIESEGGKESKSNDINKFNTVD